MKKKFLISIIIILVPILVIFGKYGVEYISTIYRIKKSNIYNKNNVVIEYDNNTYNVKIPKGLGDFNLKGNVIYTFKSMKSAEVLKEEFIQLYGEKNVIVKDSKYYYINIEKGGTTQDNYVICVQFGDGTFTDVSIISISSIDVGS